jgi:hypothetical protein
MQARYSDFFFYLAAVIPRAAMKGCLSNYGRAVEPFKRINGASMAQRRFNYRSSTTAVFLSRTCRSYYLEFVPVRGTVEPPGP